MITIGSWNLQNFAYSTIKKGKRDISEIMKTIQKFDLIALQEIRDPKAVEYLASSTHKYWVSEPVGSSQTTANQTGKRKEYYAFLWRDPIQLIDAKLISGDTVFVRAPAIGFFTCGKDRFDFVLSTIHVVWGKKSDRTAEISKIPQLLRLIRQHAKEEKNIIFCGDFNTDPKDFPACPTWTPCIHGGTVSGSFNTYDNFWITEETPVAASGILDVKLSDHFPIYASFCIDGDCDDQEVIDLNIKI